MKRKKLNKFFIYLILVIFVLIINLPLISMVGTSLKAEDEVLSTSNLFPTKISWVNYQTVLGKTPFLTYIKNSLIITISVTIFSTMLAVLAGYALSRFTHKIRVFGLYSRLLIVLQMFPIILLLIPLFIIFKSIGILNTRLPAILIYITITLPFSIWLMTGFFDGIPVELEEAGTIDGCSQFQSFYLLVLPVSSPGVAAIAIFSFIFCWNEYLLASIFLKQDNLRTLPIGLQTFIQQYTSAWGSLMAASTLTIIPTIIFLIFMQKYIIQGLTAGAVKG